MATPSKNNSRLLIQSLGPASSTARGSKPPPAAPHPHPAWSLRLPRPDLTVDAPAYESSRVGVFGEALVDKGLHVGR